VGITDNTFYEIELPSPDVRLSPSLNWGSIDAFPSPAYWAYQVLAKRICGGFRTYRLGSTLREEVCACILGGHGIPARIGLAAFQRLKSYGIFEEKTPELKKLEAVLASPLKLQNHYINYRFAKQKAKYLHAAMIKLDEEEAVEDSGQGLRNWLLDIPGIGLKTASWIARNWLSADDVAIIDIHIYRAGIIGGYFDPILVIPKDYLYLEEQFIVFCHALGVRPSELDAVIWYEMMKSPNTVHKLIDESVYLSSLFKNNTSSSSKKRHPYSK
jgi:thermostable 8-oxoguanine DNA glycosylase